MDAVPVRVVIADEHPLMRDSLRLLLDGEEGIEVVAEADDLVSSIAQVYLQRPDVLVLDFRMSDGPSSGVVSELRVRSPGTRIVVLTMHDDPAFAKFALAAGALGFVRKEFADSELAEAIRAAAGGEVYVSSQLSRPPAARPRWAQASSWPARR